MKKINAILFQLLLVICLVFSGCGNTSSDVMSSKLIEQSQTSEISSKEAETTYEELAEQEEEELSDKELSSSSLSLDEVPDFSGSPYITINNNEPEFSKAKLKLAAFESYSELDSLGRCGAAFACIGAELMPTGERESISQVKPTGWHTVKYDFIDGKYLYNRCHLIGYQLTAENANEKNLITGTRYFNVEGMLPFENMVADYIKETGNHVLYRVTPVYDGDNLIAKGVQMEAMSVEDNGEGISFNVFVYNNQPGVEIDYATGESNLLSEETTEPALKITQEKEVKATYILNINSHKFHEPSCSGVKKMSDENKEEYVGSREEMIAEGYVPCKICNP